MEGSEERRPASCLQGYIRPESDLTSLFHDSDTDDTKHVEQFWLMMTLLKVNPEHQSSAILAKELIKVGQKVKFGSFFRNVQKGTEEMLVTQVLLLLCSFVCAPDLALQAAENYNTRVGYDSTVDTLKGSGSSTKAKVKHSIEKRSLLQYTVQTTRSYKSISSMSDNLTGPENCQRKEVDERLLTLNAICSAFSVHDTFKVRNILKPHAFKPFDTACMWVCAEQVRRQLFRLAVEQGWWIVVKQRADHTLYEDERWWALQEAYKHQQWDVMLQLAEYGLTEVETMLVRKQLVESADWGTVLHMLDRGVDIAEIKALSERKQREQEPRVDLEATCRKVLALHDALNKLSTSERKKTEALSKRRWRRVFFYLQRSFDTVYCTRALQTAIQSKAWHVVIPLVRLGTDPVQRDSLFTLMIKRRHWGVCRALLEQGVQLCLDALPQLMEMSQWTLVARVMEFDVGDEVRQQIMQRAMERREGSVVWRCISTMQYDHLTEEERKTMFQQAFQRGM
jgi:hypothetical protein